MRVEVMWRTNLAVGVLAATKPGFVTVIAFFVKGDGWAATASHRSPPAAFEAAAIGRLFVRHFDPLVDVAVDVDDARPRDASHGRTDGVALIEALDFGRAPVGLQALVVGEHLTAV